MKFLISIILCLVLVFGQEKRLMPEQHHGVLASRMVRQLMFSHYKKFKFNDNFSENTFNGFIQSLDPNKMYFIKNDIKGFEDYKFKIDDNIRKGKIDFAYKVFNLYQKRLQERITYIYNRLEADFDYTIDENYYYDRSEMEYENTLEELDDIWRKRLKNESLSLKLAGKDESKIKDLLKKRYGNLKKMAFSFNSEDVFQSFMNSLCETIDPHTNYFSPKKTEDFKINMRLSLEGIGALLGQENEFVRVVRVIPGGPADLGKELKAEDKIIGVGQNREGEIVDVVGWRVDDVVQLIRGKKGSYVRLLVRHDKDLLTDHPDTITIKRDKIKLEEQAAKSKTITINRSGKDYKLGVIDIPTFYMDFDAYNRGDANYKSTSRDVRKLINEFKTDGIDGLIIDLRNNGGGSLLEAIDLTGLFISTGPVVQVKDFLNRKKTYSDLNGDLVYDGPLMVLVNQYSASASEIFSAAIQDYRRGLVIGNQTYGKGTVQTLLPLKKIMKGFTEQFGQVKYTNAKFYRINGGSTQNRGVIPDINFPSYLEPKEFGESSNKYALPYDQIEASSYTRVKALNDYLPMLYKKHKERVSGNLDFKFYEEDINNYLLKKEKTHISLNEKRRKEEIDKKKNEDLKRENIRRKKKNLKILTEEEFKKLEASKKGNDFFLQESGEIIVDYIKLIG